MLALPLLQSYKPLSRKLSTFSFSYQKQESSNRSTSNHRSPSCPIYGMFNQGNCTRPDCSYRHICLTCEGNHPRVSCLLGRDPLITNNIQASLQPLTVECEASLPLQLPFSMPSPPTLLYSEPILSSYSQPSDFTHHSLHDTLAFQFEGPSSESYPISRSLLTAFDYNPLLNL